MADKEQYEESSSSGALSDGTDFDIEIDEGVDDTPPFDSSCIDIDFRQPAISNVIARLEDSEIDLAPDFQRQQDLWPVKKQSQLIESIILKIPLPAFYFDEERKQNKEGIMSTVWHVVDGLQRLCAIRNFIIGSKERGPSVLRGLEFLHNCEGKTFEQLPKQYKRIINETQLTAYLMKPSTPVAVKYNIFKRVNTGGVPLNSQEIRHALNQGFATHWLGELAALPEFVEATDGKIKAKRMQDRELVNRFLAFYLQDIDAYKNMDSYLDSVLKLINEGKTSEPVEKTAARFKKALSILHHALGDMAFRREPEGRINKALFEVFTVLVAKLDDLSAEFFRDSKETRRRYEQLVSENDELTLAVTTSTANLARIRSRYAIVQKFIDDIIY